MLLSQKKKIALVTPSLSAGGAERVMSILANSFVEDENIEVHLILLTNAKIFYQLDERVIIHRPAFDYKSFSRLVFTLKIMRFLRSQLKKNRPDYLLSFGGRYNSFAILSALGLGISTFISDRSKPGISYGKAIDIINKFVYKGSDGFIAQTNAASQFVQNNTGHKNLKVIGNPIPQLYNGNLPNEKIILNVGRFIKTKQQDVLIKIFNQIDTDNRKGWQLWFLGEGKYLEKCKKLVDELNLNGQIQFLGNQLNVHEYYKRASIFAFTSVSEGFPNSLGEAMSAGCACISFDCLAGPSDLIDSSKNGILINEGDISSYKENLEQLMLNESERIAIQRSALEKIVKFDYVQIAQQYKAFIFGQ